ncbi:MAG: cell division protein FtsZ, partial [Candidatus Didemnitutus sp.]|nr:cell division protein FtsZ [Candidatus Didemnitutus sp.]
MHTSEISMENCSDHDVRIKLIGVGGGGSNAVDRLKSENLDRLQLAIINTDLKALSASPVAEKLLLGTSKTRGLSAGGDPELGRESAEVDRERIEVIVRDTDLVFLVAGLGGGTGSGATPLIADLAREAGALVIAFVTLPFSFEGGRRRKQAEEALAQLRTSCHAVVPLSNDLLLQEGTEGASVLAAFARADEWMGRGVKSVWGMLSRTGLINLDFQALRTAFQTRGGKTLFGLGVGTGDAAAKLALEDLKACPLLQTPEFARKADRLMVNITGGPDLSLAKVNELMTAVTEEFGREAHVIMGAAIDESMTGRIEICVLGAADLGGRSFTRVTPAGGGKRGARSTVTSTGDSEEAGIGSRRRDTRTGNTAADDLLATAVTAPIKQQEFGFGATEAQVSRGSFERSDRNLFEGQDLDVPTYLRRGIKIAG